MHNWVGYPHLDSYHMIIKTKVPPADEIFRNISYEPQTKLSNLPLSIFNLIFYADSIGADDKNLLTIIVIYLKKYKSDILETLDTKKHSLSAVVESLAFHCTTTAEKGAKGESFAHSISRFDSLHIFYLQLDQPNETEHIRLVSYNTLRNVVP